MELTTAQIQAVKDALSLDTHPHLSGGLGTEEEPCTIAALNLALTGRLTDDLHPCMSPIIRTWVIKTQDAMPAEIRDSTEWRSASVGIAGSTAAPDVEKKRVALILAWMWEALGDEAVLAAIPEEARPAWDRMLSERTPTAAHAAAYAAATATAATAAAATAAAYAYAAAAAAYAYAAYAAYWTRRDPAALLAALVAVEE